MSYPHGGKYSNDPYFVTDEEERRMERELLRERAEAACTRPVCEWPHCPCAVAKRQHAESDDCWCNPTLDYVNEETGAQHWIHHEPN